MYAFFHRDAFDWNERDNVGCAQARMRAFMDVQVNQFCCFGCGLYGGINNDFRRRHKSNHTAIMIRVHLFVQNHRTIN